MKLYPYVGPPAILKAVRLDTPRHEVTAAHLLTDWAIKWVGFGSRDTRFTFTYVVQPPARLFVADRHSEHVACARAGAVLTAGEITFERSGGFLSVVETSNLSTGYCPESHSWPALSSALVVSGFQPLEGFTFPFEFRYCVQCSHSCVIKDGVFECPACGHELPTSWNYQLPQ